MQPSLHLWVYNHLFVGVSDQVAFAMASLRQHGYQVTVGKRPSPTALNLVIENFSSKTRSTLVEFCQTLRKRVAVIMTEHIDWAEGQLWFHGIPLGADNDYMHPQTMIHRLRYLLECLPYIRCLVVLGDLPALRGITDLVPGVTIRSLPFPVMEGNATKLIGNQPPIHDALFTGLMTQFRQNTLETLRSHGVNVTFPGAFLSRKRRNDMNCRAKVILNLPQRSDWRWLSPMRIIAALATGRPTISLGTRDTSCISSCCTQVGIEKPEWVAEVRHLISEWSSLYRHNIDQYNRMAEDFERGHPFPHDLFEMWAVTDGLWKQASVTA